MEVADEMEHKAIDGEGGGEKRSSHLRVLHIRKPCLAIIVHGECKLRNIYEQGEDLILMRLQS